MAIKIGDTLFHADGTIVTTHSAFGPGTQQSNDLYFGTDDCFPSGYRNIRLAECETWQKCTLENLQRNVRALANYSLLQALMLKARMEKMRNL